MLCWETDARTWVFLVARSSATACPGFPCAFFGWRFLSRMGKCITGYGRPQAASMPHRTEMGIHAHFPLGVCILLRNRRRKRSMENPGQAFALRSATKKHTHGLGKKEETVSIFLLPGRRKRGIFPFYLLPGIKNIIFPLPLLFTLPSTGGSFFAGRQLWDCLSRIFRASFPAAVS